MKEVGWQEFLKRRVGTGPFRVLGELKDYRTMAEGEVYATLVANRDYWNPGFPKIRTITFVQHSPKEALNALLQCRVDLVTSLIPKDTLKVAENLIPEWLKASGMSHTLRVNSISCLLKPFLCEISV